MHSIVQTGLRRIARQVSSEHPDANLLSAFADRSLLPDERTVVAAHLAECPECRKSLFLAFGQARIDLPGKINLRISRSLPWAAATACVATLTVILIPHHRTQPTPNDKSVQISPQVAPRAVTSVRPNVLWRIASSNGSVSAWRALLEKSSDGGKTWNSVAVTQPLELQAVVWDGANVWLRGAQGKLLHSSDEGGHWTQTQASSRGPELTDTVLRIGPQNSGPVKLVTRSGEHWTRSQGVWHRERDTAPSAP